MVPVRINVLTTSAGIVTSAAPLSSIKLRVIALFISTGTSKVPPTAFSGIDWDGFSAARRAWAYFLSSLGIEINE
jgi:hypothetical protein